MEIPDFCTRATTRVTRKRKTEEEADPDYCPEGSYSTGTPTPTISTDYQTLVATLPPEPRAWEARRVVRRSKLIQYECSKPPPEMNFIERNEYSIEDWKEKALQARQNRVTRSKKEQAAKKRAKKISRGKQDDVDDEGDSTEDDEKDDFDYGLLSSIKADVEEPYRQFLQQQMVDTDNFVLGDLPDFVMGTGKGKRGGPPGVEFKSLWEYELRPLSAEDTCEDIKQNLPWEKRDAAEPNMKPDILSIVASFSVGRQLDLKCIAHASRNVEYNPDRFAPLIMRIRQPKTTGLIFASGRIIVTGNKSEDESRQAARKYARIIQKLGYKVKVLSFQIHNISASCNLRFRVRLNKLNQNRLYGKLSYEPELFPGLVIPLEYPRMKIIIFGTGSVLMSGAKSVEDLQQALKAVYPLAKIYAP